MTPAAPVMLGGIPIHSNPSEIRWNFSMKTAETRTMGGNVIQVLGTTISDLTIQGYFGRGRRDLGDTEAWQDQVRFRDQVMAWSSRAVSEKVSQPLTFSYAPRGWNFQVYVRSMQPLEMSVQQINPMWSISLFPLDTGATDVVSGLKDLYIQRLMDGVGWKQTSYNGPDQAGVDSLLSPYSGSVHDYLRAQTSKAFVDGLGPTVTDSTVATVSTAPPVVTPPSAASGGISVITGPKTGTSK